MSSVKAENENPDFASAVLTCAAPVVLCFSIINLRNSIKNDKKISRNLEERKKTTQKQLKDLNNKIDEHQEEAKVLLNELNNELNTAEN